MRPHPSTKLPGEGTPEPGCSAAGARAALAAQKASAPRSSFAFCLARATPEQKADGAQEGLPPQPRCVRCCPPPEKRFYPQYQLMPQINMTILKGEGCLVRFASSPALSWAHSAQTGNERLGWCQWSCALHRQRAGATLGCDWGQGQDCWVPAPSIHPWGRGFGVLGSALALV